MTPTLAGRLQTRWILLANVGVIWTLLVAPWLPGVEEASYVVRLRVGLLALGVTAALGVVWELLYHLLQQLRWEKDWPILFGLLTGLHEGLAVRWVMVSAADLDIVAQVPVATHWWLFGTTWVVIWLVAIGPLRVVTLRWRYRGGEWA